MKVKSLLLVGTGIAAASAAILTGQRYRRWKEQQRQRLLSQSRLLETSRGTVEYQMEGGGPVILVLHGSPGGYDQGMAVGHFLGLSGFTLLAFSRPGYRRTPLSSGQTPEAQADLYSAALDALNISQVVIIALSGGGPSALQFALRYPERCRGLLMLSGLSQDYTEERSYRALPPVQRQFKRLLDQLIVFEPFLYLAYALSKGGPNSENSVEFVESLVMNSTRTAGYRNDMQQFESLPAYPFKEIALPTLIVHGTADQDVPFSQAQALATAIPNAQLVPIEGANHLSILTGNQAVDAIRGFLQKLSPSPGYSHERNV